MYHFTLALLILLPRHLPLAVPRESPIFDPEIHVPDISDSESVPHEERRESEIGCHWTARLKFTMCGGDGECHDAEILAFDFQRRAWDYYRSNRTHGGLARAPPIEEAFWIASTPKDELQGSFELCPGLVIVAFFIVAEVQFAISQYSPDQLTPLDLAKNYMSFLQDSSPLEYEALQATWPVDLAKGRADAARDAAAMRKQSRETVGLPSVDIVIARCSTSLRWLWELPLPPHARIIIYEKCARPEGELERQVEGITAKVADVISVSAQDHGEWMTGECGTYLRHILAGLGSSKPLGDFSDFTVFIHDDAPRHLKPSFLGLVFRALTEGSYDVPFLNLAHERYMEMSTPCLRELYRSTFGRELHGRVSTYCCGHFVVASSQIRMMGRDGEAAVARFARLWTAVSEGSYTAIAGGPCQVANMPCYVVEHIWHVLFGEDDTLPWRSEDARLPLIFRYEGGRETRLPSPLKFETYMHRALLRS